MSGERFPWANLEAHFPPHLSELAQARRLGVDPVTIQRARRIGFTPWAADKFAVRLGLHPGGVWPNWFDIDHSHLDHETDEDHRRLPLAEGRNAQRSRLYQRRKKRRLAEAA